jgi:hypothetical protein
VSSQQRLTAERDIAGRLCPLCSARVRLASRRPPQRWKSSFWLGAEATTTTAALAVAALALLGAAVAGGQFSGSGPYFVMVTVGEANLPAVTVAVSRAPVRVPAPRGVTFTLFEPEPVLPRQPPRPRAQP